MKTVKFLSLLLLALFISTSCKKEKPRNCCPGSTTEYKVGNGRIYVPNIFTPNGDGLNDVFFPVPGNGVALFKKFTIKDRDGYLLHSVDEFEPYDFRAAWRNSASNPYIGKFYYSMIVVSTDGTEKKISGVANSNLYGVDGSNRRCDCTDCRFATQHDGMGGFCDACPSLENICQ
jgi:hypothetical protein